MLPFKTNISFFDNVKEKTPKPVKLSYFMDGHRWRVHVDHVRAAPTKAERKQRKLELPAATLSGVFSSRGSEHLVQHSGLLCLDIDRQDNPHIENFTDLKYQIGNIKNVAYAGASVSGIENGIFVLMPIKHPAHHVSHFKAIEQDLWQLYGIRIDKACKDVGRLRFVSYDLQPVWNWQAKPYERLLTPKVKTKPAQPVTYKQSSTESTEDRVEGCIAAICSSCTDITGQYEDWPRIAFALNNEFGEAGRQYFHEVSQFYPGYDPEETDRKYTQCKHSRAVTIASFFEVCKRYGITWKGAGAIV